MPRSPRLLFPHRERPLEALVRRIAVAVGLLQRFAFDADPFQHTRPGDVVVCIGT